MSNHTNKEWLQKWLDGDLTRAEERTMQQAAQQDPFLADALAGLESQPEVLHVSHLSNINQRLAQRVSQTAKVRQLEPQLEKREAKIVPMGGLGWRRIAAAVALLVFALGGMWFIGQTDQMTQSVAMQEEKVVEEEEVVPAIEEEENITETSSVATKDQSIAAAEPPPATPETSPEPTKSTAVTTRKAKAKEKAKSKAKAEKQVVTPTQRAKRQTADAPIASATSPPAAVEAEAPRTAPEPYEATQGRIAAAPVQADAASIAVEEQASIPTEYSAESVQTLSKNRTATAKAQPTMGFKKFAEFVKENLNLAGQAGKIRWVFQLDDAGNPVNVRVEESPTGDLAKQARLLFEKGGKWKSEAKNSREIYQYELEF